MVDHPEAPLVRPASPASAPDLLLAVLGEYVAPGAGGAWQETLVSALELFGHTSAASRQAIARAVREGALLTQRVGRRSWLELSAEAGSTLRSVAAHSGGDQKLATGLWDVFVIRGPRDDGASYRQRTKLLVEGLGHLGNGVWIGPARRGRTLAERALASEPDLSLIVLRAEITYPEASKIVQAAWDLDEVRRRYAALLDDFGSRQPLTQADCFLAWTDLQRRWFSCGRRDPDLPEANLPTDWPREPAHRMVERARRAWRPSALAWFDALAAHLPPPPVAPVVTTPDGTPDAGTAQPLG